jgi:murein DD-endopeptidase MepM/ murein hydrolase activator NlpD
MRRQAAIVVTAAAALAGCIPQVERDMRAGPPPVAHDDRSPPPYRDDPYPGRDPSAYDPPADDRPGRDQAGDRATSDDPPRREQAAGRDLPRRAAHIQAYPAARPVWEARPATADAATIPPATVVARPGDTLARIAQRTGSGAGAIAHANGLAAPYAVEAGQRLEIPGGRYHSVHPGEAGIAIARAYGVEWSRIVAANDLTEPFGLRVGQRILIPGTPAGGNRVAERAAAFSRDVDDILTGGEPAPVRHQAPARGVATPTRVLPPTAVVAAPARLRGGFAWPVEGRVVRRFGPGGTGQRNDGIKIAVPVGTPVHAAADGVVAYVGDGIAALGGLVIVRHGDGWTSVYGHASKLLVQRGQAVRQGQTIALSGDSGFADRPEVHFELRKGRTPVDPTTQLPGR